MTQIIVSRRRFGPRRPGDIIARRNDRAIREAERRSRERKHPKMTLVAGQLRVTVPYAPRTSSHSGFAPTYSEVARPGRSPLVLRQAPGLWRQSFDLFLGSIDIEKGIGTDFLLLRQIAESHDPIAIVNGPGINRLWRITGMTLEGMERNSTNSISRGVVTIEMTEAVDLKPAPGPVKGGKKPPPATAPAKKSPSQPGARPAAPPAPRTHVVKKGQTLSGISNIYYRTPHRWKEIATANNIRNANLIKPGQKLRIP